MSEKKSQLSKEDIDKLFQFVRSKYVRFKDVQFEIVDHLATGIEELQANNPDLSFDQALKKIYSEFPVTGFAHLVDAKTKALNKYWLRRFKGYLIAYFKLPKILLTILLTLLFYTLFKIFGVQSIFITGIGLGLVLFIFILRAFYLKYIKEKEFKDYLVIRSYSTIIYNSFFWFYYFIIFILDARFGSLEITGRILPVIALFFALYAILTYAMVTVFPQMLKEELDNNYSHLRMA